MAFLGVTGVARTALTNLTTVGITDWRIESSSGVFTKKASGSAQIAAAVYTSTHSFTTSYLETSGATHSWSDGDSPASGNLSGYSHYTYGSATIDVTLGTTELVVEVYCGVGGAAGITCTPTLGDSSASCSPLTVTASGSKTFLVTAAAGSAGQTLSIKIQGVSDYIWLSGTSIYPSTGAPVNKKLLLLGLG